MLSFDKFLALVEKSQLLDAARLAQVAADFKSAATLEQLQDAHAFANHLVELGMVTLWQAKKLLEARHRGFYLGRYKLLDHLGTGGMSSVYLAEHVLMQRRVAIKVLPQNRVGDSSYLARFHLEAQAAAALDHRNIVRAYDLDNEGKIHYLVMEYVEGRDLHALVCQDGPMDYHSAAHCIAQAAAGLQHAHGCGLVHRDIKPANLLLDLKGTIKILDMGLAKFTCESRTDANVADEQVLGTADYLAPEQAVNSQTVDHRADIYALGCTLYYLLTGHPPFAVGTSHERMTAHQQQAPPSVLVDRPDAPAELVTICRKMMEKLPEHRYQSASEVETVLGGWLENEKVAGRIGAMALAARSVHAGPSSRLTVRGPGSSTANLVSGSAVDLHGGTSEPPQISPSLQDTDSNFHRATRKITPEARSTPAAAVSAPPAASGSGAHPTTTEQSPAAPPVVAPPLAADDPRWLASTPGAALPPELGERRSFWPNETSSVPKIAPDKRSAANLEWWILVASALMLVALLMALLAIA